MYKNTDLFDHLARPRRGVLRKSVRCVLWFICARARDVTIAAVGSAEMLTSRQTLDLSCAAPYEACWE